MAIAYRGTSVASGTSSASLSKPAAVVAGDAMVVVKCDRATSGTTSAPTGWTRVASAASANYRIEAFVGVYGLNGMSAGPWSFSGTTRTQARLVAYSGVDTGTPSDVAASARSNASGTYGCLSITPVTNDNWVIAGFSFPANNYTWSAETCSGVTLTERIESANSTYSDIAVADGTQSTAQATGNSSATPSTGAANGGVLVALRPAAAQTLTVGSVCEAVGTAVATALLAAATLVTACCAGQAEAPTVGDLTQGPANQILVLTQTCEATASPPTVTLSPGGVSLTAANCAANATAPAVTLSPGGVSLVTANAAGVATAPATTLQPGGRTLTTATCEAVATAPATTLEQVTGQTLVTGNCAAVATAPASALTPGGVSLVTATCAAQATAPEVTLEAVQPATPTPTPTPATWMYPVPTATPTPLPAVPAATPTPAPPVDAVPTPTPTPALTAPLGTATPTPDAAVPVPTPTPTPEAP